MQIQLFRINIEQETKLKYIIYDLTSSRVNKTQIIQNENH